MYDDDLNVQAGLDKYFVVNCFGKPNYDEKWLIIYIGPIPFVFPNLEIRRRAVRFHDIHHVLTEFPTTLRGEAQIGAWELGSGCADLWAAWYFNLLAFFLGLFLNPRELFQAFASGRRAKNLFKWTYDERLLNKNVGDLRRSLGINQQITKYTRGEKGSFVWFAFLSLFVALITGAIFLLPPVGLAVLITWAS